MEISIQKKIGILLFNEVEGLDFAGPFEVFSITTNSERDEKPFCVHTVAQTKKFIDESPIITSAGISAGINMSFYIIKKLLGEEIARATAKRMEYDINIQNI